MSYLKQHGTRRVPQWVALPGQTPNSAGGNAWAVDCWTRLRRFLVLGSEGGSYYASEWTLTRENAKAVEQCVGEDGPRAVAEIVRVSTEGRAPKNDPALYALALAAGVGDTATRQAALAALPQVARTGTHLFQFAGFVEGFRGWGRSLRRAVGRWYTDKPVDALAYQAVKFRQRDGMTHRDLLRLVAPRTTDRCRQPVARRLGRARASVRVDRPGRRDRRSPPPDRGLRPRPGCAHCRLRRRELVREYGLPREALQPEHLTSLEVWEALLEDMPMTALIRNLATMTRIGVIAPGSDGTAKVVAQLADAEPPPQGSRAPDRGARRASDVRVRPRCPRPRRVEPGARGRRCPRRGVLRVVRQRRADRQAPAARARRLGIDGVGRRRGRSRPLAA